MPFFIKPTNPVYENAAFCLDIHYRNSYHYGINAYGYFQGKQQGS